MDKIILLIGIYYIVSLVGMMVIGIVLDLYNKTKTMENLNIFKYLILSPILFPVLVIALVSISIAIVIIMLATVVKELFKKGRK